MNFVTNFITERLYSSTTKKDVDIPLILQRFVTSQVLEDRLEGIEKLCRYSCNPELQPDFGSKGVISLLKVIQNEPNELLIVNPLLQILLNLTKKPKKKNLVQPILEEESEEEKLKKKIEMEKKMKQEGVYQKTYLSALIEQNLIATLIGFINCSDTYIRMHSIKLLKLSVEFDLLFVKKQVLKEKGIIEIIKCLESTNDVIISEIVEFIQGLLLRTENDSIDIELDKIFTSQKGFEKIFRIVVVEGLQDGEIMVEDCLKIVLSLIEFCHSNRKLLMELTNCSTYFKNLLYMKGLVNRSSARIILLTLKILKILFCYENTKKILQDKGAVEQLIKLSLTPFDSIETKNTEKKLIREIRDYAMFNLGQILLECKHSQETFESFILTIKEKGRYNALVRLITLVCCEFDEKFRQISERTFFNYIYKNESAQKVIVGSIKAPTSSDSHRMMSGIALSSLIFSNASISINNINEANLVHPHQSLYACKILGRILRDNERLKDLLLELKYSNDHHLKHAQKLSYFTCLVNLAISFLKNESVGVITAVGFLALIIDWVRNSKKASRVFMKYTSNFLFFVELLNDNKKIPSHISGLSILLVGLLCINFEDLEQKKIGGFSKESLKDLLVRRVGMERFLEKKNSLMKDMESSRENYSNLENDMRELPFCLYDPGFVKNATMDLEIIEKMIEDGEKKKEREKKGGVKGGGDDGENEKKEKEKNEEEEEEYDIEFQHEKNLEIKKLKKKLENKDSEINKFKESEESYKKKIVELQEIIQNLRTEVVVNKTKIKKMKTMKEKNKSSEEQKYRELEDLISKEKMEKDKIQKEYSQTNFLQKEKILYLRKQNEERNQELMNLANSYNELEELMNEKEQHISSLKTKLDSLKFNSPATSRKKESDENVSNTENIKREFAKMKERMKNIGLQKHQLEQQIVVVSSELQKSQQDLMKLRLDIKRKDNEMKRKNELIKELTEDLEGLVEANEELSQKVDNYEKK